MDISTTKNYQNSLEILRLLGLFCSITRATSTKNHTIFVFILIISLYLSVNEFYKQFINCETNFEFFHHYRGAIQMLNPTQSLQMCTSCGIV